MLSLIPLSCQPDSLERICTSSDLIRFCDQPLLLSLYPQTHPIHDLSVCASLSLTSCYLYLSLLLFSQSPDEVSLQYRRKFASIFLFLTLYDEFNHFTMVILWRIFVPNNGLKWAQPGEKLTTNNHTTRKINKNEKNSKLRVFFWLVPLPLPNYDQIKLSP